MYTHSLRIVGPVKEVADGNKLHWAIDDPNGDHIVIEVLDGTVNVHDNTYSRHHDQ